MFGWFFFFFQAEDGIRDWSVTGVQTCALPIWVALYQGERSVAALRRHRARAQRGVGRAARRRRGELQRADAGRSEERRVGKECRSGWARDHGKKKRDTT